MTKENYTERRRRRIRYQVKQRSYGRPRLTIFRSNSNIFAQIIDDSKGVTLASASTIEKDVKAKIKGSACNITAAKIIGSLIAERAQKQKIKEVVFDRGHYLYHGKIKALADAARESGLAF